MPEYDVTIRAIVTKTIRVEADSEDDAIDEAHEIFTPRCTDMREHYEEHVEDVKIVDEE